MTIDLIKEEDMASQSQPGCEPVGPSADAEPSGAWRTIDSAPRDGTHILAAQAGSSFGWRDMKPLPEVQTVVHWFPDPDEPGFYTSVNELEPQHPLNATHWRPITAINASTASPEGGQPGLKTTNKTVPQEGGWKPTLSDAEAALTSLINRYGYHDDNTTPKDWNEWVFAREVRDAARAMLSAAPPPLVVGEDKGLRSPSAGND